MSQNIPSVYTDLHHHNWGQEESQPHLAESNRIPRFTKEDCKHCKRGEIPTLSSPRFTLDEIDIRITFDKLFQAFRHLQRASYLIIPTQIKCYDYLAKEPQ